MPLVRAWALAAMAAAVRKAARSTTVPLLKTATIQRELTTRNSRKAEPTMTRAVRRIELLDPSERGSVVLNCCDPDYPRTGAMVPSAAEILIRLVSYVPFCPTLNVPTEYLFAGGPVLAALQKVPVLLQEGIVVPDIWAEATSFAEMAHRQYEISLEKAATTAIFLDAHTRVVREYAGCKMGQAFRQAVIQDLAPGGALRRVVGSALRPTSRYTAAFERAHQKLAELSTISRQRFVEIVSGELKGKQNLVGRWGCLRYYTTPLTQDPYRLRELPDDAVNLLLRSGAVVNGRTQTGLRLQPMEGVAQRLTLLLPNLDVNWFQHAEALASAAIAVRAAVPEARRLFERIVGGAEQDALQAEISTRLAEEYARQIGDKPRGRRLQWALEGTALGLGVVLDLVNFPTLPSAAVGVGSATAVTVGAGIARRRFEHRSRPWHVVSTRLERELAWRLRRERRSDRKHR